jgi:hypothetical protein
VVRRRPLPSEILRPLETLVGHVDVTLRNNLDSGENVLKEFRVCGLVFTLYSQLFIIGVRNPHHYVLRVYLTQENVVHVKAVITKIIWSDSYVLHSVELFVAFFGQLG